jgi:hypothetical protein
MSYHFRSMLDSCQTTHALSIYQTCIRLIIPQFSKHIWSGRGQRLNSFVILTLACDVAASEGGISEKDYKPPPWRATHVGSHDAWAPHMENKQSYLHSSVEIPLTFVSHMCAKYLRISITY